MFEFDIERYQPRWLNGQAAVAREHGQRLGALHGRTLTGVWLAWDIEEDEWFRDCPVLLDFDGEQVEINHYKFDDLALTWATIDPRRPVHWPGFELKWRPEPLSELQVLRGMTLQGIELLEWVGDDAGYGSVDVSFVFPDDRLTVFNALDENGLNFTPPKPQQRSHTLR
ncbi:hypothetical protein J7F03_38980 [Streptomyces sp. ISL-43]|uniref:hypothetical protein n=1 Tax=Streptomyces sp. ISL-43 TaxID=2819183 RepID=UPI001BE869DC|nr:hypothetical protein [Streptomyces sp. ISL-43]MBT2452918.1 hypothetical protein [Streptomyces sp. ISL-43]